MCRILACSSTYEQDMKDVIHHLPFLAKNGNVPIGFRKGHSEGWGMVGYRNGEQVFKHRSSEPIYKDENFTAQARELLETTPTIFIGHARKATIGKVAVTNNHPFIYNNLSLCHNGSFFQSQELPLKLELKEKIQGSTDTEYFFYYFIQLLQEKKEVTPLAVRIALKGAIKYLRKHHEYTALNVVVSDGMYMWALREVSETDRLVKLLKLTSYFTLYWGNSQNRKSFVVSSEQLRMPHVKWNLMKNHELIEYDTRTSRVKSYSL